MRSGAGGDGAGAAPGPGIPADLGVPSAVPSVCGDRAGLRDRGFVPGAGRVPIPDMRRDSLGFAPGDLGIPGWSAARTEKCNFNFHPDCKFFSPLVPALCCQTGLWDGSGEGKASGLSRSRK